jgi:HSF-type DNA-binding
MEEQEGERISGEKQALTTTTSSMENVESGDGTDSIENDDDASVTDSPHHEQQLDVTTSSTSTVPENERHKMGLPPQYPLYGYPSIPGYVSGYPPYGGAPYPFHMTTSAYLPLPPPSSASAASGSKTRYVDHAHVADPEPNPRRNRGGIAKPFPEVLHHMLSTLEQEGSSDVASFFPHGRAFAIHNPRIFVSTVMPRFFNQTKLTSFQRQLNLYSFKRIVEGGVDNGGYWVRPG